MIGKDFDPKKLVSYINNREFTLPEQRRELDLLEKLDKMRQTGEARDPQLEAAINSMEVAYRMQTEAPEVFDIRKESEATSLYGTGSTARGCLMAVRLPEGRRMAGLHARAQGPPHDINCTAERERSTDRYGGDNPKSRGLFNDTLVVCGSEFGRTPSSRSVAARADAER